MRTVQLLEEQEELENARGEIMRSLHLHSLCLRAHDFLQSRNPYDLRVDRGTHSPGKDTIIAISPHDTAVDMEKSPSPAPLQLLPLQIQQRTSSRRI